MLSVKRIQNSSGEGDEDVRSLHDSIRVLSEVVRHLAERVEVLETRASLTHRRNASL